MSSTTHIFLSEKKLKYNMYITSSLEKKWAVIITRYKARLLSNEGSKKHPEQASFQTNELLAVLFILVRKHDKENKYIYSCHRFKNAICQELSLSFDKVRQLPSNGKIIQAAIFNTCFSHWLYWAIFWACRIYWTINKPKDLGLNSCNNHKQTQNPGFEQLQ